MQLTPGSYSKNICAPGWHNRVRRSRGFITCCLGSEGLSVHGPWIALLINRTRAFSSHTQETLAKNSILIKLRQKKSIREKANWIPWNTFIWNLIWTKQKRLFCKRTAAIFFFFFSLSFFFLFLFLSFYITLLLAKTDSLREFENVRLRVRL